MLLHCRTSVALEEVPEGIGCVPRFPFETCIKTHRLAARNILPSYVLETADNYVVFILAFELARIICGKHA